MQYKGFNLNKIIFTIDIMTLLNELKMQEAKQPALEKYKYLILLP